MRPVAPRSLCGRSRILALAASLAAIAAVAGCGGGGSAATGAPSVRISPEVKATVQTEPLSSEGDAADDVTIWVNPADASASTIIGTDKKGGLAVYDLAGKRVQYVSDGPMNNVDLRGGFPLGGQEVSLVAASHRHDEAIVLYRVDPATRGLVEVTARPLELSIGAYGLCMYRNANTGKFYVFVDSERGEVQQWEVFESPDAPGKVDARQVRSFDVGSQTEGCVADDGLGRFFIGEEEEGIWRYGAEPDAGSARIRVDSTGATGNLTADVEGLTIAYGPEGSGFLIASSQGDSSFRVYRRGGANEYLGFFRIVPSATIGGIERTDGIDVTTARLGPAFPAGLFVAQDGKNGGENQNFKLVPWRSILRPA